VPVWVLGSAIALAVLREGAEVVLFLYGVAAGGANPVQMLFGGAAGLLFGAALGLLMYFGLLGVPIRHFFTVTGVMILLLAAGLAGDAGALGMLARLLAPGLLMALVAGLALFVVARLAARLLRPMIRAAIDPENLRVA